MYTYDRRKSPLLPLSDGNYKFLHHSNNKIDRVVFYKTTSFSLGKLKLPSGKLFIADPFAGGLGKSGNVYITCPKGEFEVFQTLVYQSKKDFNQLTNEESNSIEPLTAYLSIVFDPISLEKRKNFQIEKSKTNLDIGLQKKLIHRLCLSSSGVIEDDKEFENCEVFPGVIVQSGTVMMVDKEQFEAGMPDEKFGSWYSTLFEHGNHESWFGYMDSDEHIRVGGANFLLPARPKSILGESNLILSQTGYGDGEFVIFAELDELNMDINRPIAYHIDFEVIPYDPLAKPLKVNF
jgi:hypothetical protein